MPCHFRAVQLVLLELNNVGTVEFFISCSQLPVVAKPKRFPLSYLVSYSKLQ